MLAPTTSKCGILYVDDEAYSLKYFRVAFEPKHPIFTTTSPVEAVEILRRERDRIGIVLSDQRMPEMLGAELLGRFREEFPSVIRILTTAFSDLKSAIQAVNTGHIYQYVVKPWDVTELGMVLQRAADYHHVLTERDALMALKLSTLQRVLCSDRVNWLLLASRSIPGTEPAAFRRALSALVKALPASLHPQVPTSGRLSPRHFEIADLLRKEYRNASACLDALAAPVEASLPKAVRAVRGSIPGGDESPLARHLGAFVLALEEGGETVTMAVPDPGEIRVTVHSTNPAKTTRQLFDLLLQGQTSGVSLRLLSLLSALAEASLSLRVTVNGGEEHLFQPNAESGLPEDTINALYENFSSADISEL